MNKILILFVFLIISIPSFAQTYTVERVIDGHTLKLANGETVRLIGIDTAPSQVYDDAKPEVGRTGEDFDAIAKMGQSAIEFVSGLIEEGQNVRLEYDVEEKDKYGRLLAYVFFYTYHEGVLSYPEYFVIGEEHNEIFLNATIIKAGYAKLSTMPPNVKYSELFNRSHQEAFEKRRGLYKDWKTGVPDGTYYEYYKNGAIRIEATYKKGQLIETKAYDEQGNMVLENSY